MRALLLAVPPLDEFWDLQHHGEKVGHYTFNMHVMCICANADFPCDMLLKCMKHLR
jgi:hypothetical protein